MIRINLIGAAKPKKGSRPRKFFTLPKPTWEGPSPLITGLAVLVVSGAGLYLYYHFLENEHQRVQARLLDANVRIAAMTKVKQAYLERQKDYDAFKRRFDVIDQLRASQATPVPLLKEIKETVSHSDGVWLVNMRDDGPSVALEGIALTPSQLAALMTNLRHSGFFKNVELKDTSQDDHQSLQTFTFTLICDKAKV
jgi:type IV pilus assembly protein PilN